MSSSPAPSDRHDDVAAWPRLREISRRGYPQHRRLWNRLRWSVRLRLLDKLVGLWVWWKFR